ncbi:hypothetical protein NMY22_g10276 [Coprinellus aureogranulatus]|nr:hypothetical protein NMY22_g10276 [Coprinellus aureogranulatus]
MASTPSGSRFRTSTPIKAKPSTIVNRGSPSLPPASQAYEPQVKSVLRFRLSRVFVQSALLCWVVNTVWVLWQSGRLGKLGLLGMLSAPFGPLTLLGSVALWFSTAVPAIVLRKLFLTGKRTAATSPQKSFAEALAKPSTRTALATYALSAVALAFLHSIQSDDNAKLTIFVKSKKHPQYLNGRFLFIVITQVLGAATYVFRNVLRDRFAFRWVGMSSGAPPVLLQIILAFFVSAVSITATIPLACTVFALIRTVILPTFYQLPFVPVFLRPFTAHFLRGPYTLSLPFKHLPLLARSWFVGLTTLFLWEAAESMFDGMLSEPVQINPPTPTILVSGTSSSDSIMKYFAYAELSTITSSSVAQRQALFGDQNNVPNVWGAFVREALLLLGKDYQRLLRRGVEYVPEPPKPADPVKPAEKPIPGTPVPLLRQSILRSQTGPFSPREAILDNIASDGPLAKAVEQTAEAAHIPELFRSVRGTIASPLKESAVVVKAKDVVAKVEVVAGPGLLQRVKTALWKRVEESFEKHAPLPLKAEVEKFGKWWTGERVSRTVDACLPMRELDVVVMEGAFLLSHFEIRTNTKAVLTKLVCASLTEDRYGNVQRDIPKILEALLSFLTAVEEYQVELIKKYSPPQSGDEVTPKEREERELMRLELDKATDVLAYVGDGACNCRLSTSNMTLTDVWKCVGLKDGVARIVRTFGDKLTAFKFPPRTAAKLQGFMDFCQ